ncbi:hypothetical protein [Halothiobacillus diazotrophicus]|nr:hypothetical protein [Halothiobacillus diazotrophicus]
MDIDNGKLRLTWDAAGHLTAIDTADGQRLATYTYYAEGRRDQ